MASSVSMPAVFGDGDPPRHRPSPFDGGVLRPMLVHRESRLQTIDGLLEAAHGGLGGTPAGYREAVADKALRGRRGECQTLDELLEAVRAGESGSLVLRGDAGVGKSALLDYMLERASGCRVMRAAGVQSEMELPFAGLHQLCGPMLDRLDRLPDPQRDALGTAFGLRPGDAPDRFLVGLAVLSLLCEAAEERPLVCVVDDAQWLDRASAQVLAFVGRRLLAESVVVVFAVREPSEAQEFAGLPELAIEGLGDADARALLSSVMTGPMDVRVRDRIVAETRGNPLALLELPRGLTPAELAGGFGLPDAPALSGRIEESFRRRLAPLPAQTQRLLLVAAAEPMGESVLVWRAAEQLGIAAEAAAPAATAGLCEFGARVRFRHPLVRSAVYRAASLHDRQSVHAALADATDPEADPDRRAWHRAHAATGPDEVVAQELERSAGRAQARGGLAAAAAFLERAAGLTLEPARRADRALAAAQAKYGAGAPDAALELLATAQTGPLDELQRARVDLLHAHVAFAANRSSDAPLLLLKAARQLEPLDARLARETYLDAFSAAMFVGRLGGGGGVLEEMAQAARQAPPSTEPERAPDLLLDGLALLITEGYPAGTPMLRRALSAFRSHRLSKEEEIRWLWLACNTAALLWDDETWDVLSARHVQLAREAGALSVLPMALGSRITVHLAAGEVAAATSLIEQLKAVATATGSHFAPCSAMTLAACQGREAEASELIEICRKEATARGEGIGLTRIDWSSALLYNGLGRYEDALAAAEQAAEYTQDSTLGLLELIEAASRSGKPERAAGALERLSEATGPSGTDWARGIEARSRALLSDGAAAEALYREAIDRLARTRVRTGLARTHLLYGEWLRRERRRLDAREQLRAAHEMFTAMGFEAFARRAARELLATGETARKRTVEAAGQLTAQEAQIAALARDGLSNPEIGSQLFISPRTVEYHLHKVFGKLDISSRNQLDRVPLGDGKAA
jgi:DNA-binding CsgD family transcriptional regulator